jgi:thioredoxin 1
MSTTLIVIIAFLAALVGLITFNFYRTKNMKPVADSDRIKVLGNKNFKPVIRRGITLVDFWAPWCGPCRMMAPEFAKAAQKLAPGARLAKINTEEFPKVSTKNNIRGIPTMILYQNGREVARQSGAVPASAIEQFVRTKAKVAG